MIFQFYCSLFLSIAFYYLNDYGMKLMDFDFKVNLGSGKGNTGRDVSDLKVRMPPCYGRDLFGPYGNCGGSVATIALSGL